MRRPSIAAFGAAFLLVTLLFPLQAGAQHRHGGRGRGFSGVHHHRFHHFHGFHHGHRFGHFHRFHRFHGFHHLHGFHGFGFHHGLHAGVVLGGLPFFGFWNGFAYPYSGRLHSIYYGGYYGRQSDDYPAAEGRSPESSYEGIPRPGDRIAVPGETRTESLVVDQVTDGIVRLAWQSRDRRVAEVGLFLADSNQTVLAVQTKRQPPSRRSSS
jgi:hypothetical protein